MPLILPQNPQIGDTITEGSRSWEWTGRYWKAISTTIGYTGSRGRGVNFLGNLPTEQDLPIPYPGEENDAYVIEATGILWIWDGSSWGPVGQFTGYTGSRGAPGASVRLLGSVPTDQDLPLAPEPGDGYIVQDLGDLFVWNGFAWTNVGKITGETGPIGFTGSRGFTGSLGFTGSRGADGNFGGVTLDYTFRADTDSSQDPGTGGLKFNDSDLVSATQLYIGDADDDSINLTNYLATIDASTSELKGHFRITRKGFSEQFVIFAVTGATQNLGSYFIISCSYVSGELSDSSTAFDDGDDVLITFARTGDKGDTGFTGSQGVTGFTGSQGATGTSVRIVGAVATSGDLPSPYLGDTGDGYLVEDTGHLWLWDGSQWNDIGRLTGEVGPSGFTGSRGLGIIDTELVNDELIIIYDDSSQNNLGNIRGFQGSRGESSFFWGAEPPLNPEVGARWFYTTEGLLLVYTDDGDSQQWVEVAATGFVGQTGFTGSAGLSGVRVQSVVYPGQATAADTLGGETLSVVGGGFNAGIKVYIDSTECATTVVDQNNLTFTSPAKSANIYDVVVYNTDGSSGIKPQGIVYSGSPVWVTANALPSQIVDVSVSIILSATSNSSVTYFLQQGSSLPPGLNLSSSGTISGTVTGLTEDTVYSFTIVAIDAESQTNPREFTLTLRKLPTIEYLVVSGGGGGGKRNFGATLATGGGGAGGYKSSVVGETSGGLSPVLQPFVPSLFTYTITVGAGGAGGNNSADGSNGSGSSAFGIATSGGGAGSNGGIFNGGSGGGAGRGGTNNMSGGTGISDQGFNGGAIVGDTGTLDGAGGGGGAGQAGSNGTSATGGKGGDGIQSNITGVLTYRAGGGGGAASSNDSRGAGGLGGGGQGGAHPGGNGGNATENTGSGGGGSKSTVSDGRVGGNGGSGIVIIAYPDTYPALSNITGGLTYDQPTRAGYRVYRFTAGTGNITF